MTVTLYAESFGGDSLVAIDSILRQTEVRRVVVVGLELPRAEPRHTERVALVDWEMSVASSIIPEGEDLRDVDAMRRAQVWLPSFRARQVRLGPNAGTVLVDTLSLSDGPLMLLETAPVRGGDPRLFPMMLRIRVVVLAYANGLLDSVVGDPVIREVFIGPHRNALVCGGEGYDGHTARGSGPLRSEDRSPLRVPGGP